MAAFLVRFAIYGKPAPWLKGDLAISSILLTAQLICLAMVWRSLNRGDKSFLGMAYDQHLAIGEVIYMILFPLMSYTILFLMSLGLAISLARPEIPPHTGWR